MQYLDVVGEKHSADPTFVALWFHFLQGYRDSEDDFDPQENAMAWSEAITQDLQSLGWTPEQSADCFHLPHRCETWDEFSTILGIAVLYGFLKSETTFRRVDV